MRALQQGIASFCIGAVFAASSSNDAMMLLQAQTGKVRQEPSSDQKLAALLEDAAEEDATSDTIALLRNRLETRDRELADAFSSKGALQLALAVETSKALVLEREKAGLQPTNPDTQPTASSFLGKNGHEMTSLIAGSNLLVNDVEHKAQEGVANAANFLKLEQETEALMNKLESVKHDTEAKQAATQVALEKLLGSNATAAGVEHADEPDEEAEAQASSQQSSEDAEPQGQVKSAEDAATTNTEELQTEQEASQTEVSSQHADGVKEPAMLLESSSVASASEVTKMAKEFSGKIAQMQQELKYARDNVRKASGSVDLRNGEIRKVFKTALDAAHTVRSSVEDTESAIEAATAEQRRSKLTEHELGPWF